MSRRRMRIGLLASVACVCAAGYLWSRNGLSERQPPPDPSETTALPVSHLSSEPAGREHPLRPAVQWARKLQEAIEKNVRDYSATVVKTERSGDKYYSQTLFVKIRHEPFSVYVNSREPEGAKGDEGIFVEGKYDNCLVGHTVTFPGRYLGTVRLKPTGPIAMQDQHYPITAIGMLNLCRRILEIAEMDMRHDECEVRYFHDAKVNDRPATCIEVVHPERRKHFRFHVARIFIDDQFSLPVRYEAYDWPKQPGKEPELIEEYTYLNVKLNLGLTDADFDPQNPNYAFPK